MKNTVTWIIQKHFLEREVQSDTFVRELNKAGVNFCVIDWRGNYTDSDSQQLRDVLSNTQISSLKGSISFCNSAITSDMVTDNRIHTLFTPSLKRFSDYFNLIPQEHRLNKAPIGVTFASLNEGAYRGMLLDNFNDSVFIRPNTGLKSTEAAVLSSHSELCDWVEFNRKHRSISDNELFWLSNVQDIKNEYRFCISGGLVISGSSYIVNGEIKSEKTVPREVYEFASQVCKTITLEDSTFILDVALLACGTMKVIELNSFSSSGMYMLDIAETFKAASLEVASVFE
ncbi:hypothetical protein VCHA53O466_40016 [Vibrio chagasii]|nr:hypothetical protein VCHA53O466_40016 [Vibrio chagasii]